MPDWSYQTLFRPLLFRLPAPSARRLTLEALHALGKHKIGPHLIALMGHTQPASSLACSFAGLDLASPVGLGADLPDNALGLASMARFGVGFVELGPVALAASGTIELERLPELGAIEIRGRALSSPEALIRQIEQAGALPAKLFVRLAYPSESTPEEASAQTKALIERLAHHVAAFSLMPPPTAWSADDCASYFASIAPIARSYQRPLVVGIAPDDANALERVIAPAFERGLNQVLVCGAISSPNDAKRLGLPVLEASRNMIAAIRAHWGAQLQICAAGGIAQPQDALRLKEAGAQLFLLDAGLVYAGPGLPKRINETLRFYSEPALVPDRPQSYRAYLQASWFWMLLLGLGMLLSGLVAAIVGLTHVILPYDEAFIGIGRAELNSINERLLLFMAHDRVALAGAMVSIGILYSQLAWHALRYHIHWARQALIVSASVGFLSFFLFLGYEYFDPLHAVLALSLFIFFLFGLRGVAPKAPQIPAPDLQNNRAWFAAQIGQFGMVSVAIGLMGAGLMISYVGVTDVFVPEDLLFLCTTSAELANSNQNLIALISHDRAGFGGALLSEGLAILLVALWGIRRGARWVWWMLLLSGLVGFSAALGVHAVVGYLDWWHLFPGFVALGLFLGSMSLLYSYLCDPPAKIAASGA